MKAATSSEPVSPVQTFWPEINRAYLEVRLRRLRLLLQRRALWLRRRWQHDSLAAYPGFVVSEAQADWLLAGEDCQAEARFHREDAAAAALTQSLAGIAAELEGQRRAWQELGLMPALEVLSQLFGLSAFEGEVLLLCLAPELDPGFARLYAYLQDDVNLKYATPHLALTLLAEAGPEGDGWRGGFLPEAPLRRFGLVTLEAGPPPATPWGIRPLRLDERLAEYLLGVNRPDARLMPLLKPVAAAPFPEAHRRLAPELARVLKSSFAQGRRPVLNLVGPPGVGKRLLAKTLCSELGIALFSLEAAKLSPAGGEFEEMLRLLAREAVLLRMAFFLEVGEPGAADSGAPPAFQEVVERLDAFLVVGSRERYPTAREGLTVRVAKPEAAMQRLLWRQALGEAAQSLDTHIEVMVQQFDFGPEAIRQAMAAAQDRARLRASGKGQEVTPHDLWEACREQAGGRLEELAQRLQPCYSWEDLVLPEDVLRQLEEIAAQVAHRPQVYETWGFGAKLSRGRGISALFSGPSGTGKTMAAEVLANHLQLDLYRIDLAGVVSKYIGETEKNLRKVFDAAEESGAILFFDEADALFGKRTEVKDSHDRYANIEVNYLLQRMEDYRGLAVLATNRKSALDQAFLRRLRFVVEFPFPDPGSRRGIWEKVFPPQAQVASLDYASLARLEIPGGNIKNIALNAAFLAAAERQPIRMRHLIQAARREYAKIEKLFTGLEFKDYLTQAPCAGI